MLENKTQRGSIEPDVVGIQHGAQHRDRQRTLESFRNIGRNECDGVAFANTTLGKRRSQKLAALGDLSPVATNTAVNLSRQIGIDPLGALQHRDRGQRREVRLVLIELGPGIKAHVGRHSLSQ